MSPPMPTGAVFDSGEWQALVDFRQRADCWLINDSAIERILFDNRSVVRPASFAGMKRHVITVGSVEEANNENAYRRDVSNNATRISRARGRHVCRRYDLDVRLLGKHGRRTRLGRAVDGARWPFDARNEPDGTRRRNSGSRVPANYGR
jgi:hypothetical protein